MLFNMRAKGKVLQPGINTDLDRFIASETELGSKPSDYRSTHRFENAFLSDYHRSLSDAPLGRFGIPVCIDIGIDGYLQRGDALKIYEMAYFSDGNVLELGTHKGLSTSIIARALHESGKKNHRLTTVDIDNAAVATAKNTLAPLPGFSQIDFSIMDATVFMDGLIRRKRSFGFVFIDHWHGYKATHEAAVRLHDLLVDGGFVLFHDYNDRDNANPEHPHKVFQAVRDTLVQDARFEFCTISGCCALFRKVG